MRVQRRPSVLLGLVLAAAAAAQFFVSEEVLVATGLLVIVMLVTAAALWPAEVAARARYTVAALAVAGSVFAVVMAWPVAFQLLGPQHISGSPHELNVYVSDLLGFWVPTEVQWLAPERALRISWRFTGGLGEWNAYLGLPLTLLLAFAA